MRVKSQIADRAATIMTVPLHAVLRPKLVNIDRQGAQLTFETLSEHLSPTGGLHAGSIYLGLELANVLASLPHLTSAETSVTISTNYTLIGTVVGTGRTVKLRSRLIRRGKSLAFFEGEATDSDGTVLAKSRTVKAISPRRPSKL